MKNAKSFQVFAILFLVSQAGSAQAWEFNRYGADKPKLGEQPPVVNGSSLGSFGMTRAVKGKYDFEVPKNTTAVRLVKGKVTHYEIKQKTTQRTRQGKEITGETPWAYLEVGTSGRRLSKKNPDVKLVRNVGTDARPILRAVQYDTIKSDTIQ